MRGHPHPHQGPTRSYQIGNRARAGQQQGQRPRPERLRKRLYALLQLLPYFSDSGKRRRIRKMHNQRVPGWPLLGLENLRHRRGVQGIRAQAVHRLGRKCDSPSASQQSRCAFQIGVVRRIESKRFLHKPMVSASGRILTSMHGAEIELKFPVSDPQAFRRKVDGLDFRLKTERTFEQNTLYDSPDRVLRGRGQILRLRTYGHRCTLTHKRLPPANDTTARYKTRIETESGIDDCEALIEIFAQLGYHPVFQYEKFRTEWESTTSPGHLVVDETPIGIWAELEGDPAWIDSVLEQLGVTPEESTTLSYGRIFLNWKAETGSPADNMTFAETQLAVAT